MDVHTPEQRSFNMSRIRSENTLPEIKIRRWLWMNGFRYRLHLKGLPGKPDIVFIRQKKVIFVHGCFWHKHNCKHFNWPKTNVEFWRTKINKSVIRDKNNYKNLTELGWHYLIIWECELKDPNSKWQKRIINFFNSSSK